MPTLRFRRLDEIPTEDQEHVAFLRGRLRGQQEISGIFGAQAHWPAYMAANHKQALASYQFQGVLPQLAKEAMHVGVSMANACDF
jgi:alkylhydroperoxidase family enzyme